MVIVYRVAIIYKYSVLITTIIINLYCFFIILFLIILHLKNYIDCNLNKIIISRFSSSD